MSLQTPKQRSGLQRPSFGNTNTASSPSLRASTATDVNRKASMRNLTGAGPATPGSNKMGADLEVGDTVNVPGEMYGTVKFIGTVRGKQGKFVGVELDSEFAAKGKNDGDVDGYGTNSLKWKDKRLGADESTGHTISTLPYVAQAYSYPSYALRSALRRLHP